MLFLVCGCGGVVEVSILWWIFGGTITTIAGWLGFKKFSKKAETEHNHAH